jgi:hypothetical protein
MGGFVFQWIGMPLACLAIGFGAGWKVHDWRDASAEVAAVSHVVGVVQTQGAISTAAAVHDQAAQDQIRTLTRTLIEKVPVYVTPAADARCIVPLGFVREHDAAASGELSAVSQAPGQSDDAASGLALSAVAATVVGNYGTCRGTAEQLSDLEAWVKAEQAATK